MKRCFSIFMVLAIAFTLVSCKSENEQVDVFEFEKELTNLAGVINGEDILRYPENYDGKQIEFCGYVFDCTENTILVTTRELTQKNIDTLKEKTYGKSLRSLLENTYTPIEIPYTNNKSPRLLIGDCITFTGTVHAKLVDGEIIKNIDNITNMEIVEK